MMPLAHWGSVRRKSLNKPEAEESSLTVMKALKLWPNKQNTVRVLWFGVWDPDSLWITSHHTQPLLLIIKGLTGAALAARSQQNTECWVMLLCQYARPTAPVGQAGYHTHTTQTWNPTFFHHLGEKKKQAICLMFWSAVYLEWLP